MRYRKLDANGDYVFGHQQSDFYQDVPQAVAQAVQTSLALFTGEWFLDTTEGMPWRTDVLGKYTQSIYDATLKAHILDTQGVQSINAYASTLDRQSRQLTVTATISTIYGTATVQATL